MSPTHTQLLIEHVTGKIRDGTGYTRIANALARELDIPAFTSDELSDALKGTSIAFESHWENAFESGDNFEIRFRARDTCT